ncbi:hypothetical protein [Pseudoalteromonas luteoviolacea]|uniref:Uncharacterized protein n=1 Tax=Pseudoalteromonas luteoviolacea S4054 TaxID=1129367 RepID=A0A0F6A7B3_9GAMM|nr:hypothetical protein [Pseudoalteromonas luteoviolacea]AOT08899.1 hypothetical protein S4054249_13980 [Pseudoalteromonas luteoviolacea]AOT13812.1 hypothetical protein S40542_13950 [Pseudoalteromonas luteoviolacea]AOT18726.1 hypothetical protein S4054_13955 [Pseudoalteromonas luteoviolacea]KKE81741.1 hypothetical protein N479_21160 [Pseudoalteromonas luteoviolacea S4054]KZN68025.1 hypothetical protein N481_23580 [Pseudoalteromonas luteoviolacea S4047-1]
MRRYADYSIEELRQAYIDIDKATYPDNYQDILEELALRESMTEQQVILAVRSDEIALKADDEGKGIAHEPSQTTHDVCASNSELIALNPWFRRVTSVLTIGGSFLGITQILSGLPNISGVINSVIFAFFVLIYVLGIVAAVRLFEKSTVSVVKDNLIFWVIQIPMFMSPFIGYQFTNGAFLNIFVSSQTGLNIVPMLGSLVQFSFFQYHQPWVLGINPAAIIVSSYFYYALKHADKAYKNE